ncbi:MAG: dTMP kinase [Dehalococcoidia bacterium]|nr:dTMP kinase [Dehalococcoidia bacterium]
MSAGHSGRFIVLEGGEGAGKSTLASASSAERLKEQGKEVVAVREPGGTEAGELVRQLLRLDLDPHAELFAFLAARAQLVTEVIHPALERGATVICDRFEASTFAYQGWGRGLELSELYLLNGLATHHLEPDLVLFLDLEPSLGLQRKHGEDGALRIGQEGLAFHERVRAGYLAQMDEAEPGTWVRLDASKPPEQVIEDAWAAVG